MPKNALTFPTINGVAIGAAITGNPADVGGMTQASVVATLTGGSSPTGTVTLQGSNDPPTGSSDFAPTNWATVKDLTGTDVTLAFTDNGTKVSSPLLIAYRWLRATWTNASGSGTLTVRLHAVGP